MKNDVVTKVTSLHFIFFIVSVTGSLPETDTSTELDLCKSNAAIDAVCQACTKLPYGMAMSLKSCCHDYQVLGICDTCTSNPTKCLNDVIDLETNIIKEKMGLDDSSNTESESSSVEDGDASLEVDKRYGRVFFGRRPVLYSNYLDKRFGRLFFGRRPLRPDLRSFKQKRFGKLFMNKKSVDTKDEGQAKPDKRYGRLFMTPYLDKRYGAFRIGKPSSGRYFWK